MVNTAEIGGQSRKLAAILHADVVGFSRLMGEDEAGTHRSLGELRRASAGKEEMNRAYLTTALNAAVLSTGFLLAFRKRRVYSFLWAALLLFHLLSFTQMSILVSEFRPESLLRAQQLILGCTPRIDGDHALSLLRQGSRQVGHGRGLAHAALARGDRYHPTRHSRLLAYPRCVSSKPIQDAAGR